MSATNGYREFAPPAEWSGMVECIWTSVHGAAGAARRQCVLPDNSMDLLFDFTGSLGPRVQVIGTMTRPLSVATTGRVDLLGVRFRPAGLPCLLELNAADLTDTRAGLEDHRGAWASELWHRLAETSGGERIRLVECELFRCIRRSADPYVQHCVERIEATGGDERIGAILDRTGLTPRQIERKFARNVGIPPKAFARVVRFRRALQAAEAIAPPDWATVAANLGYADQPHLVREFKAFSGQTPAEYRRSAIEGSA